MQKLPTATDMRRRMPPRTPKNKLHMRRNTVKQLTKHIWPQIKGSSQLSHTNHIKSTTLGNIGLKLPLLPFSTHLLHNANRHAFGNTQHNFAHMLTKLFNR